MKTTGNSVFDVIAVRYGTYESAKSEWYYRHHAYREPDETIRMDYFFWVLRNRDTTVVVDTGFDPAVGSERGRTTLCPPGDALHRLGIDPHDVSQVIITHFHYDHIGNVHLFPNAEILVNNQELDFWTSPWARRFHFAQTVRWQEIAYIENAFRDGRVRLFGDHETIADGLEADLVGGHTPGQLVVTARTRLGEVVLASDAVHFYEEVTLDRPFALLADLVDMYKAYEWLRDRTSREGRVLVAGHDPSVMERFPGMDGDLAGLAVRIGSEEFAR